MASADPAAGARAGPSAGEAPAVFASSRAAIARDRALDWVAGVVVVVLYLAVQLAFLQGPHPYDPARYFTAALDFPDVHGDYWTLRIGLVGPVRLAVLLFGPSEASLYAVPLASGVLLALAVYVTMLLLFGDRVVAACAALVTVLNAPYLLNSSHIFPDTTGTATFTAGIACLVVGARLATTRPGSSLPTVVAALAGVFFGWTYLVREFSPLLLPAVVAAVVLLAYPPRRIAVMAVAALATFSLELVYGLVRYGNPVVRVQILLEHGETPPGRFGAPRVEAVQGELTNVWDTAIVLPRLLLAWRSGWALVALIVLLVLALLLVRDRRLWLFGVWFLGLWATFAVIGLLHAPSGRWILNITNVRYWYALLPALAMGAFAGAALLARRYAPAVWGISLASIGSVVVALMVLVPGFVEYESCRERNLWRNIPATPFEELRSWLGSSEADAYDVIHTQNNLVAVVDAFTATTFGDPVWEGRVEELPGDRRFAIGGGTDALLVLRNGRGLEKAAAREAGHDTWFPVFVSGDGRLVALARASSSGEGEREQEDAWAAAASARRRTSEARDVPSSGCGVDVYTRR